MSKETVVVELTPPDAGKPGGFTAGSGVGDKRYVQVTPAAPTVVIDGITYTRTSPLRTVVSHGGLQPQNDLVPDSQHSYPGPGSVPAAGNTLLAIFSATGT